MDQILTAIHQNKFNDLCRLVDEHGVCNEKKGNTDIDVNRPLVLAVELGRVEMVEHLVRKGALVFGLETGALRSITENFKVSPITRENGDRFERILDFLLPHYIDVGFQLPNHKPPDMVSSILHHAVHTKNIDAVRFSLAALRKRRWWPHQNLFQWACFVGDMEILDVMLSSGFFKVDDKCLQYACGYNADLPPDDPRLVHYLLKAGGCACLFEKGFLESLEKEARWRGLIKIADSLRRLNATVVLPAVVNGDTTSIDAMLE